MSWLCNISLSWKIKKSLRYLYSTAELNNSWIIHTTTYLPTWHIDVHFKLHYPHLLKWKCFDGKVSTPGPKFYYKESRDIKCKKCMSRFGKPQIAWGRYKGGSVQLRVSKSLIILISIIHFWCFKWIFLNHFTFLIVIKMI